MEYENCAVLSENNIFMFQAASALGLCCFIGSEELEVV